jgi:hypothetical protein
MLQVLAASLEALYGDAVECGVALTGSTSSVLVRALLNRPCLREPTATLVERYGTKSSIMFTVVGTITKTSWMVTPSFAGPAEGDYQRIRDMIHDAQGTMDGVREQVMTLGGGDSVSVAPLAVFRDLQIAPP